MSIGETEALEFKIDRLTSNDWQRRLRHLLPENGGSTDPLDLDEGGVFPNCGPRPMVPCMAAVVIALGTIGTGESSRQIPPLWETMIAHLREEEERVADFFEAVTYDWDEDIHIARMAARRFSEQTHADY